jgi:hypothetical protein
MLQFVVRLGTTERRLTTQKAYGARPFAAAQDFRYAAESDRGVIIQSRERLSKRAAV